MMLVNYSRHNQCVPSNTRAENETLSAEVFVLRVATPPEIVPMPRMTDPSYKVTFLPWE